MTSIDSRQSGGGGAWGSLLSVQDFAAVTSVGFTPVGFVSGTSVVHLGYVSKGGRCSTNGSYSARTDLASAASGPFERLLRQRYGVRRRALSRAVEQCKELGGDGIVGVTLSIRPFPAGGTEFTVQGTAVRASAAFDVRPAEPFSSHLSAPEFARLLLAGWVPTAMVFGIALGARHDDTKTLSQTRRAADGEVKSYTQLVRDTRRDARAQLEKAVAQRGADGVVVSAMTLHIGERECPAELGRDHVAEAAIVGTAISSFNVSAGVGERGPLVIMRVNRSPAAEPSGDGLPGLRHDSAGSAAGSASATGSSSSEEPTEEAGPGSEGGVLDRLAASRAAKRASRSRLSFGDPSGITKRTD